MPGNKFHRSASDQRRQLIRSQASIPNMEKVVHLVFTPTIDDLAKSSIKGKSPKRS